MDREVILTGATGLIGSKLFYALKEKGYAVKVFTHNPDKAKQKLTGASRFVYWDYKQPESWRGELNGVYGVIHLAGANLFAKRWTEEYKKEIMDSRVISTANLINAAGESSNKPAVFVCASAVGYYGDKGDMELSEDAPPAEDFLARVTVNWENEAFKGRKYNMRVAAVRTGVVLSREDGAFPLMKKAFDLFVGGPLGSGRQFFPWIHIDDLINIYVYALENESAKGTVNAAAPEQIRMREFATRMGDVLKRPAILPVPEFALKIALGEFGGSITASQRVIPEKLLKSGFKFIYKNLDAALKNLTGKK